MIKAVDLFCGAGGESTGLKLAAESMGKDLELLAVNHWDVAIDTHTTNHPFAKHLCESIQSIDPIKAIPSGRLNLLWASPECTHHSNARGGKPKSDQSRASAWLVLKWLSELYVERVIIENVPEFKNWGPLGANGAALKSKKGETFKAFIQALEAIGYKVDYKVLCAADYGDPTTRKRLFIQAVRGNRKIKWPEYTHVEKADLFSDNRWRPAKDIIDWNLTGQSIFTRKKPLSENTIARIEAGIKKYWGEWAEPFLVVLRGTSRKQVNGSHIPINSPLPTITAGGGHIGLVEPFIVPFYSERKGQSPRHHSLRHPLPTVPASGNGKFGVIEPFVISSGHTSSMRIRDTNKPLSTVVTKAEHCLVQPLIVHQMSGGKIREVSEPLPAVTTRSGHGLLQPFIIPYYGNSEAADINDPLNTVTTKDRFSLVEGDAYTLDIRYRMLQPHELAAAQGFPSDYVFTGNKTEQVKQIGNAVPVNTAKALCREILKDMR